MSLSKIQFLKTVLKHKLYVYRAGCRLRVPFFRLAVHDLSKFSPTEFAAYARNFYGDKSDPAGFNRAWLHHLHANDHHWESWIVPKGQEEQLVYRTAAGSVRGPITQPWENVFRTAADVIHITIPAITVLPMSMVCVREMVADWFAAGKAYSGAWPDPTNYTWYKINRPRMALHVDTEMRIGLVLAEAAQWRWL